MEQGLARVITIGSIVITVASLTVAVIFARKASRIRVRFDVARAALGVGAILAMAAITHIATPLGAVVAAIAVGLGLGFAQGSTSKVRSGERGLYATRSPIGIVLWGAGIVIMQAAGIASRTGIVKVGQTIAWFSVCLGIGLLVGRNGPMRDVRQTLAGAGAAMLFVSLTLPAVALVAGMVHPAVAEEIQLTDDEVCDLIPTYAGALESYEPGMAMEALGEANCIYVVLPSEEDNLRISIALFASVDEAVGRITVAPTDDSTPGGVGSATSLDIGDGASHWSWVQPSDCCGNALLSVTKAALGPFLVVVSGNGPGLDTIAVARDTTANIAGAIPGAVQEPPPEEVKAVEDAPEPPEEDVEAAEDAPAGDVEETPPASDTALPPVADAPDAEQPIEPEEAASQAVAGLIAAAAIGLITWGEATGEIGRILGGLGGADEPPPPPTYTRATVIPPELPPLRPPAGWVPPLPDIDETYEPSPLPEPVPPRPPTAEPPSVDEPPERSPVDELSPEPPSLDETPPEPPSTDESPPYGEMPPDDKPAIAATGDILGGGRPPPLPPLDDAPLGLGPVTGGPPGAPPPSIDDAVIYDPATASADVAVVNGGPGANPATVFTPDTDSPGSCSVFGLPRYTVNTATRNLVIEDIVYAWGGLGPGILLRLTHNSFTTAGRLFGPAWHFAYESHVEQVRDVVHIWGGAGKTVRFRRHPAEPGRFDALDGDPRRLEWLGDEFVLVEPDGVRCRYGPVTGGSWQLQSISDTNGNDVSVGYDGRGRLTSITDPADRVVHLTHGPDGRCTSLTLPDGRTARFGYDPAGRLAEVIDLAGIDTVYGYDDRDRIVSVAVDQGRKVTRFAYAPDESRASVSAVTDATGGVTCYELVSRQPRVVAVTSPGGGVTRCTSAHGLTIAIEDATGVNLPFATGAGPVAVRSGEVAVPNHAGGVTYDNRGNPSALRSPSGHETTITYDDHGQPITVVDPLGAVSTLERDIYGNVVAHTAPDGDVTRFHYDEHGVRLTAATDPTGATTHVRYDANDRVVAVVNADGTEVLHEYSCCAGVRTVDELGQATTFRRDDLLRVTAETDALGRSTIVSYDDGRPVAFTDPLGRTWRRRLDSAGRIMAMIDPLGQEIGIDYNAAGFVTAIATERGHRTHYALDGVGRPAAVTDPLGRTARVDFDDRGRVQSRTNARGQRRLVGYDADGSVAEITVDGAELVRFDHDAAGRPVAMHDHRGITRWHRDQNGRVVESVDPDGLAIRYAHTQRGCLSTITLPGATTITYDHDQRGRVTAAHWPGSSIELTYDPTGRLVGERRSNGTTSEYRYDAVGDLAGLRHGTADRTDADLRYMRDDAGRIVEVSGIEPVSPVLTADDQRATHDAADQIDRLGATSWHHDADGNVTQRGDGWDGSYDESGRLIELRTGRGQHRFTHDGLGRQVTVETGGRLTVFHYDPTGRLLAETDGAGSVQRWYVHCAGRLAAWVGPDGTRFLHADQGGNTIAVTDEAGKVVAAFAYTPFGEVVGRTGPEVDEVHHTFAGLYGVRSDGDGWYATVHREYHAPTGRFVQPDPIGMQGGTNRYSYAANDPVNWVDPEGTLDWPTWSDVVAWRDDLHDRVWGVLESLPDRFVEAKAWADREIPRAMQEADMGHVRPHRDRLVGTDGPVDPELVPGISTANRVLPRVHSGVSPEALPSTAEIQRSTMRDLERFGEAAADIPGSPQQTVTSLVTITRQIAEGDPRAIIGIADQARGPLSALSWNRTLRGANKGTDLIKQTRDWIRRSANVREAARQSEDRSRRGCGAP